MASKAKAIDDVRFSPTESEARVSFGGIRVSFVSLDPVLHVNWSLPLSSGCCGQACIMGTFAFIIFLLS